MLVLSELNQWLITNAFFIKYGFAALGIAVAYFIFKKRDEIGRDAIENTVTTLIIVGFNIIVFSRWLNEINGFFQQAYAALGIPTLPADFWASTPFLIAMIVAIIAGDFADYWSHRVLHTKWGWPAHSAHHSDTHVNGFTTLRLHVFEAMIMSLTYVIMLTWLQLPELIPFAILLTKLHNMYVHMNIDIEHGWFKYLIASPRFHRWHHADTPEAYGKNLANIMPIYDKIFGTYYVPGPCHEKMGALDTHVPDKDPVAILVYPLKEWARMLAETLQRPTTSSLYSSENSSSSATLFGSNGHAAEAQTDNASKN